MRRCFLAVPIPPDICAMASKWVGTVGPGARGVKWVAPEDMHLTLKFFGGVDDRGVFEISRAIQELARDREMFSVEVHGLGAFPDIDRPRTIWAGIGEGREDLLNLQQQLDASLEALGFTRERRRFSPHLTLGRVRGEADFGELPERLRMGAELPLGAMEIEELTLFSSELHRHGPEYTRMATAHLR